MNGYTPKQQEYINSVDGNAHMSAVEIIGDLEARHNALRESVAWERECCQDIRPLFAWSGLYLRHGDGYVDGVAEDLRAIQEAARAEVDRLLEERGKDV